MNRRPRILVLCPDVPFPIIAGGHMRMASIIPALAQVAELHVVFFERGGPVSTATSAWFIRIGATYGSLRRKKRGRIGSLPRKALMVFCRENFDWFAEEQQFFDAQIAAFRPDIIWLETPYLARYVMPVRGRIPVVIDYWGLLSEGSYRDFLRAPIGRKLTKLLFWISATAAEKRYAALFSYAVSVSAPVSSFLQSLSPRCRVFTVPNGIVKVDAEAAGRYDAIEETCDLIMTGDFSFAPNIDAALYFTAKILPLIRKSVPAVTLRLCGRDPVATVTALASDSGISVTGHVDDLLLEIARARIYILPLRMGSGIRSKLFDVFPLGKPIVTTTTGAEGLELVDGKNCRIVDTPEQFAQCCSELLGDPKPRRLLGEQARKLASETYAQSTISRKIATIVATIMEGR